MAGNPCNGQPGISIKRGASANIWLINGVFNTAKKMKAGSWRKKKCISQCVINGWRTMAGVEMAAISGAIRLAKCQLNNQWSLAGSWLSLLSASLRIWPAEGSGYSYWLPIHGAAQYWPASRQYLSGWLPAGYSRWLAGHLAGLAGCG